MKSRVFSSYVDSVSPTTRKISYDSNYNKIFYLETNHQVTIYIMPDALLKYLLEGEGVFFYEKKIKVMLNKLTYFLIQTCSAY